MSLFSTATRLPVSLPKNSQFLRLCTVAPRRKNRIHLGSADAGPKVAAILSVMETCKRLGLDVRAYLADVLPRLAAASIQRVGELASARWTASRAGREAPPHLLQNLSLGRNGFSPTLTKHLSASRFARSSIACFPPPGRRGLVPCRAIPTEAAH